MREVPHCPTCGSSNTREIVYGLPGPDATDASRRDEIVLGGCVVTPESPEWRCNDCQHEWGTQRVTMFVGGVHQTLRPGFRACKDCGKIRHDRYFQSAWGDHGRCLDCWDRRWKMNQTTIHALDPDYLVFEDVPSEPPALPLDSLGYTRALHGMWICVACADLYEPGKPYDEAQLCACRTTRSRPTWQGFDYNERVHLCECCCAAVLPSGSRWSTWFCYRCKWIVAEFNDTIGETVIPIGRHTMMTSAGREAGRPDEDESIDDFANRFADALESMSNGIDRLHEHRRVNLRQQLFEAGLPERDVRLVRFLEIARRWNQHESAERSFDGLRARMLRA